MKKLFFLLAAVMLSVSAWAQTLNDVTATYLKNADFSQGTTINPGVCTYDTDKEANSTAYSSLVAVDGWTASETGNGRAGGIYAYGSDAWLGNTEVKVPATNPQGAATGNALGVVGVWSNSAIYTQNVTLAAGNYILTIPIYSARAGNISNRIGFVTDAGKTYYAETTNYPVGAWTTEKIKFTLASETSGKISLGYTPTENVGIAHSQCLFVDGVTIEYNNIGEDYTDRIANPSFEDSDMSSWTTAGNSVSGGDTGRKENSSNTYNAAGCDGDYLFNTWNGNSPQDYFQVSQNITLPAGKYVLYAKVATDKNGHVTLFAGDQYLNTVVPEAKDVFTNYPVYFEVSEGDATVNIGARSEKIWFKVDDFRLFKLADDTELVPQHFETTGSDWRVSGGVATLNASTPYYIAPNDRYIVAQVSGAGTAIGDTKLTTLNSEAEGHYPTYTWTIGGDTYFVWDIQASRFSLWYTLGDNLSLGTANTQLNTGSTAFTFSGSPSIASIASYVNYNSLPTGVRDAEAYQDLTDLIAAAEELQKKLDLDDDSDLGRAIATAKNVASSTTAGSGAYENNGRKTLLEGIQNGLATAATEVDVTDIYIRNHSFETGWAAYWTPKAEIAQTNNQTHNAVKQFDLWGRDGSYIYNQWDEDNIAGYILQNLTDLAAGSYTATATVCGANGKTVAVYIKVGTGDVQVGANEFADNKDGKTITTPAFTVGKGDGMQIGVTTADTWFRADNFRLTYVPVSEDVDKTDLRRMILTAQNLKELKDLNGEKYDSSLEDLSKYIAIANSSTATATEVEQAVSELAPLISASYKNNNQANRPTASAPSNAGKYYLYNVATKSYVTVGSRWGTRAIANDYRGEAGILFGLEGDDDNGFAMSTSQIWGGDEKWLFASTSNAVNIDGWTEVETYKKLDESGTWVGAKNEWAKMPWLFEKVPGLEEEGLNVYRLYRTSGDNRDYGLPAGSRLKYVMSLDRNDIMLTAIDADGALNELYSYWILVSEADRLKELDAASLNSPVNASFLIKNPDLEGQNAQAEGTAANNYQTNGSPAMLPKTWTFTSSTGNTTQIGNADGSDIIGDRGIESWNSTGLDAYQTITLPKAGLYRLRVNGFYRPGGQDNFEPNGSGGFRPGSNRAAIRQHKGEVTMNAYLYAGDQQVPLMSINTGDMGTAFPFGIATEDKAGVGGYLTDARFKDKDFNIWYFNYGHVPNNVTAGLDRTREEEGEGRYSDNSLLVYAPTNDYELTIGVKKGSENIGDDWTLFDHFNLWYMGSDGSADFAKAYNDYRAARIEAINVLFDTYHYTELRDTVYTRYLNDNGFDLTTKYGSPVNYSNGKVDVWNEGDPKGTKVFIQWLKEQLDEDDNIVNTLMTDTGDLSAKVTQLKSTVTDLDYDVAVAKLAYQMAEFYFFSRGVQQFYKTAKDGSSQMIGSGSKETLMATNKVDDDIATLENIELRVLNTLKQAMGVSGYDEKLVMDKEGILTLTDSLTTHYADPSTLAMNNVTPSTNDYKDYFKPHAVDVARNLTPPTRAEFDLTFMLPRADVIGLEQWDWLPVFEWLSDDDPSVYQYNYDVHSYNNTYKGHNGYFAERWRSDNGSVGLDENTWAVYQNLNLPQGLYRFSAATFARNGGASQANPADNAYIAMNLSKAHYNEKGKAGTYSDDVVDEATLIPTVNLDDISSFYEITNDDLNGDGLANVNVGMYIGSYKDARASWIGMSQMRLYKIPEVTISEDKVYRVGLNADGHGDGYSDNSENTGDAYEYWPEGQESTHETEVAENPYLFNISPAARITGVKRTFKEDTWQTLTLPFDMSRAEFMAMLGITDVVINQFTGSRVRHYETWSESHPDDKLGARVDLYFERETGDKQDSIYAHRPCLVWIPEGSGLTTPTWAAGTWYKPGSVEIVQAKEASYWPDKDQFQKYSGEDGVYLAEFSFDACYAGVNVGGKYVDGELTNTNDGLGSYLPETSYYISGNEFKYVPRKDKWDEFFPDKTGKYNPVRSKGLRGYFTYHGDSEAVASGKIGVLSYEFDTGNGTDKIELNSFGQVIGRQVNGRDVTGVYNMGGQLLRKDGSSLEGLSKGVYIVNGNKVVVK